MSDYHIGNNRFRYMAALYKSLYMSENRVGRRAITREVVDKWRQQKPPGRFLKRNDPSKGHDSSWEDAGDEMALGKAAKVLGEGAASKNKPGAANSRTQEQPNTIDPGICKESQNSYPVRTSSSAQGLNQIGLGTFERINAQESGRVPNVSPIAGLIGQNWEKLASSHLYSRAVVQAALYNDPYTIVPLNSQDHSQGKENREIEQGQSQSAQEDIIIEGTVDPQRLPVAASLTNVFNDGT